MQGRITDSACLNKYRRGTTETTCRRHPPWQASLIVQARAIIPPARQVLTMLMADRTVFDHIRQTLSDLVGAAPNRASAVSLEAALRSVTSHPLVEAGDAVLPLDQAAARQSLADLLVLVSHSQWRFSGYHRRKLTICAMWLRTAERYWDDSRRSSSGPREHFLFPRAS